MDGVSHGKRATLVFNLAGRLIAFNEIMQKPLPPIQWLVEPLIPHQTRTVVFGEYGSMKSWLLLDLGLHIAAGTTWLKQFTVPEARSVLYLDEEMSEYELRRRIKLLGAGADFKEQAPPFRAVSQLGLKFDQAKVERLLSELKEEGFDPDIVMVETLRRVLIGSENEAQDVSEFWHSVSPILTAGKTLIISHHMRKPSAQGRDEARHRASGSTDILAGADSAFAISRGAGDVMSVECVKSRTAKEAPSFMFSLHDEPGKEAASLRFTGGKQASWSMQGAEARATDLIAEYFEKAPDHTVSTKEILAHLEANGVTERTAWRALRPFRASKTVKVKHGFYRLQDTSLTAA